MENRKVKYCLSCKKAFYKHVDKCKCDSGWSYIDGIAKDIYQYPDNGEAVYLKVKEAGFNASRTHVKSALKRLGLNTKMVNHRKRLKALKEYVNSLETRPKSYIVAKEYKISPVLVKKLLDERFGKTIAYRRRKQRVSPLDEKILKDYYSLYKGWEENKTYPMPIELVSIAPLLKREGMI